MLYVIAPINFILRLNPLGGDEKGLSSEVLLFGSKNIHLIHHQKAGLHCLPSNMPCRLRSERAASPA